MSLSQTYNDQVPVGAIGPERQRFYPLNYKSNGYWEIGYDYCYKTSSPIELNTPYIVNAKLYKDYQYLSFNGQETYTAKDSTNIKTTTNIYLFANNFTGTLSGYFKKNCIITRELEVLGMNLKIIEKFTT